MAGPNYFGQAWNRNFQNYSNSEEGQKVYLDQTLRNDGYTPSTKYVVRPAEAETKAYPITVYTDEEGNEIKLDDSRQKAIQDGLSYKRPDPIGNWANYGLFGAIAAPAALANGAVQGTVSGASNLLKTWLPRMSFQSAYGSTPAAIWGDTLMMAVPTGTAAADIYNNGLNLENATELGLGVLPIAGEAYNGLRALGSHFTPKGIRIGSNIYGVDLNSMAMGFPKMQVTPAEQWQLQSLPGMQIKSLMTNGPLEKQLSKNGTISTKQLQAYIGRNDVPTHDKYLIQQVLDNHAGETHLDYNALRKEVQEMIPVYNRVSQTKYENYGIDRLGRTISDKRIVDMINQHPGLARSPFMRKHKEGIIPYTYTFESSGLSGNTKHYTGNPLGHSRTFTAQNEPDILYIMESQSDWAQNSNRTWKNLQYGSSEQGFLENYQRRRNVLQEALSEYQTQLKNAKNTADKQLVKSLEQTISEVNKSISEMDRLYKEISSPLTSYMQKSYTQRQIQENLKYAAEQGQTKMRYPTRETAAKIEDYTAVPSEYKALDPVTINGETFINDNPYYLKELALKNNLKNTKDPKEINKLTQQLKWLEKIKQRWRAGETTYELDHEGILDYYSDFPKQYEKLFGKGAVRQITDAKGNTWYEVDVPENYRNGTMEMLFKQGGKLPSKKFKLF